MMRKKLFKGIILSGMLWANVVAAHPLQFEIFNEGIEDTEAKKPGYAVKVTCKAEIEGQSLIDSMTAVLHGLPSKGKGVLLEVKDPFSNLAQTNFPWVGARFTWSVQVYKEEGLPFFRSDTNVKFWEGDIFKDIPSNRITLKSRTNFDQEIGTLLDPEGDSVRKGELRPASGKTYYFR